MNFLQEVRAINLVKITNVRIVRPCFEDPRRRVQENAAVNFYRRAIHISTRRGPAPRGKRHVEHEHPIEKWR